MSTLAQLRAPVNDGVEVATYAAFPRAKRSFNTILDASHLFDANGRSRVTTTVRGTGADRRVEVETAHSLKGGAMRETLELSANGVLTALRFERRLVDERDLASREEKIDFTRGPIHIPPQAYPEVMLPFVLRWLPYDGERRSVFAWIVDRFVARTYCEWKGKHEIHVPAGKFTTVEMMMYPDLNDWVSLGAMLSTLAKPFLPKYRMWFEASAPHRLIRFEGPYGPPGAPEIVLELC
jgi:hypothetical protein